MTVVADTGALYAAYDRDDEHHELVKEFLGVLDEGIVIPPLVLAELDHLAAVRLGEQARATIMAELADTTELAQFSHETFVSAADVALQYGDLALGLTDAAVAVAASAHHTRDLLTVDQRHFRVVRPIGGGPTASFRLLPFDA